MVLISVISCLHFCLLAFRNSGFALLHLLLAVFSNLFLISLINWLVCCQGWCIVWLRFLLFLVSEFDRIMRSRENQFLYACLCLLRLFSNSFDLAVMMLFLDTRLVLEIVKNCCLVIKGLINIIGRRDYRFVGLKFGSCFEVSRKCYFGLFTFFVNYLSEYKHEA